MYSTNPVFKYNTGDEEEEETAWEREAAAAHCLDKAEPGRQGDIGNRFRGTTGDLEALGKIFESEMGVGGSGQRRGNHRKGDLRPKVLEILQRRSKSRII